MDGKNNKKSNVLVSFLFPNNTNLAEDVDTELLIQKEIAEVMRKLVSEKKVRSFIVADDSVISEKLKKN